MSLPYAVTVAHIGLRVTGLLCPTGNPCSVMELRGIEPLSKDITCYKSLRCLDCTDFIPPLCSTTTVYKEPLSPFVFKPQLLPTASQSVLA